ncbi:MAG: DUF5106 domain-containing protein [Bacteroidales bacterium]|nr:DUF5106 domain-containing protein [Bacteroidales bacterium]
MSRSFLISVAVLCYWMWMGDGVQAQSYEITLKTEKIQDSVLYIGQHYRDEFVILDSAARRGDGTFVFKGKRNWQRGVYAFIRKEINKKKKETKMVGLSDFVIDGSQKFTIASDSSFRPKNMKVTGNEACKEMYAYMATITEARAEAKSLGGRMKGADSAVARKEQQALSERMTSYEKAVWEKNKKQLFFQLVKQFSGPEVPDEVENKPIYYRTHYWDGVDLKDHTLIYTPDLFNKMNYYFFGVLYHADADTICRYVDMTLQKMEGDSTMMKYFIEFIAPRYYRSTKNIGWDYVWCYLVENYYLKGRCPWATPGDIENKRKQARFLEKSLIGAYGQELIMSDTTQLESHRISSHRQPQKYVILWFWDPDCHHCQEQTAALIDVYNKLEAEGNRMFEVYAVGYEADVNKWKNYVKKHNLPFKNVGGPNVNIDYQEAYNVHGAPTMIILNADRQIIMNKSIPASSLVPFIEQYEKLHPEQRDREPSFWQKRVPPTGYVD